MRAIKQYILFFLAVAFFFSIFSFLLDIIFYKIDYGSIVKYDGWGMSIGYGIFFSSIFLPWTLPVVIFYNFFINSAFEKKDNSLRRTVIGLFVGFIIGFQIKRNWGWDIYIGKYKPLKYTILCGLVFLCVELLRTYKNRRRIRKQLEEENWNREMEKLKPV